MRLFARVLISFLASSCYRAHYVDFSPENPNRATSTTVPVRVTGWQSFFLFGWVPGTRLIDASSACGGADNIESIRTRQTFLQGLVTMLASYYINIYAPWNGAVYCHQPPSQP